MSNNATTAITITVLYFASLAEQAGKDEEILTIANGDLGAIYADLSAKYGFDLSQDKLAVAINHQMTHWQAAVHDGDVLAFIPPVAGG
ncbi:MoaD/ThiS family protein [Moraxella sp. ZJ142]|uniref:MoaD/ThiS family protein n=1 Tax=Moraxella marmotae TaxID=3344520 RepID=UPI0035D40FC5